MGLLARSHAIRQRSTSSQRPALSFEVRTNVSTARQRNAELRTNVLVALGAAAYVTLGVRLNGQGGAVQVPDDERRNAVGAGDRKRTLRPLEWNRRMNALHPEKSLDSAVHPSHGSEVSRCSSRELRHLAVRTQMGRIPLSGLQGGRCRGIEGSLASPSAAISRKWYRSWGILPLKASSSMASSSLRSSRRPQPLEHRAKRRMGAAST
jgi:hypothetical protein